MAKDSKLLSGGWGWKRELRCSLRHDLLPLEKAYARWLGKAESFPVTDFGERLGRGHQKLR